MRIMNITQSGRVTTVSLTAQESAVSDQFEQLLDQGRSIPEAITELFVVAKPGQPSVLDLPDAPRFILWLHGSLTYVPSRDSQDSPVVHDPTEGFARRSRISQRPVPKREWKAVRQPRAWFPV